LNSHGLEGYLPGTVGKKPAQTVAVAADDQERSQRQRHNPFKIEMTPDFQLRGDFEHIFPPAMIQIA
jgi:hypothetical protein